MPNVHSRYPASSSARWIGCPGSIRLSEQCQQTDTGSTYAEEGTIAHEAAEVKLRIATDKTVKASALKAVMKSEYWDGEMDEATDYYRDLVLEHLSAAGPAASLMIEQRVDYSDYAPEGFGTSDAVIINDDTIEVIDLKYGKGVRVDAKGNTQMRCYALGALQIFGDLYDFSKARYTIVQPRLDHVSTEEITVEELLKWGDEVLKPAAELAQKPDAPTHAGEHCRWCPARAICRTRAEANLALAKYDFAKGELLGDEEISDVLSKADELARWVADIQDYALQQALSGVTYSGYKLVEGRSNRKYADELKVADTLKKAGYDEAMLYERKLLGLTAMEKLVGKKKLTETLGDLIIKPQGKPVLVPVSDRREAINTAAGAAADFSQEV